MLAYTGQNIVGSIKPGFIGGAPVTSGYYPGGNPLGQPIYTGPTVGGPSWVGQAAPADDIERQVQKQIALRDAASLESQLKRPFPEPGRVRVDRWEDRRNHGFMGDKPNRTKYAGKGANADTNVHDRVRLVEVPSGTKALAFPGRSFGGAMRVLPPGRHGFAAQSIIVMPNVDLDGMLDRAVAMIGGLASPAKGCLINQQNFRSFGVVQALYSYIDRLVAAYYQGTPYANVYANKKRDLENKLLSDILANQKACASPAAAAKAKAAAPKAALAAPAVCPSGTFKATNAAIARAYQRAGYVESPLSCYGRQSRRGSFRAATKEEAAAYSNAGMQQLTPGCWGRSGAQRIPGRPGAARRRPAPKRRRRPRSYRGEYLRRRTIDPNVRLRVGQGFVGGFVVPPSVDGYFDPTVGGCGCGYEVEYE